MQILVVDDSKSILVAISAALSTIPDIRVTTLLHPMNALDLCATTTYDLVMVDYTMPVMTGVDLIRALRQRDDYQHVPIVMLTSESERSVRLAAIEAGATEFLSKPFDALELKARIVNLLKLRRFQLDLAGQADMLQRLVDNATAKLAAREEEIIWRLARAIEYRDGCTGDHISRVAQISTLLAEEIGMPETQCRMIYLATPLHDVGKIGIADGVLTKPGRLTSEELVEMRRHVEIGVRILENGSSELLQIAEGIAAGHHEKWDGTGYPKGLKGSAIPIEARIVAIADVFEALCSHRPYKKAWTLQAAREHILSEAGRHFDPECVAAFARRWPQIEALMTESEGAGHEEPAPRAAVA
ncbi:putative two-component system response regulator [Rhizobium sp. RU20A]|uniref:HD domain-containing phosphohydrolase n=1 Tax=Rhizobium sp. RU20A TaxID=1907412 RepID=UPI000954E66B|nr:HD domain-containing phosphohydrolase [Rhizobium sp. RU20A]SIQ62874.1 putative two-component system response regulator [Rhizobium sp. RU20A]